MNLNFVQYKIPQNVGIEDKIVGPLTLRQLIILAVSGGISYVLFAILSKFYELNILEYIIIALPALLGVAFALVKINNVTLLKFVLMFSEFSIKPKKRVWDHRGIAPTIAPDLAENKKEEEKKEEDLLSQKAEKASNLRELTQVLDSGGFEHVKEVEHEDMDEIHDDDLVSQAYFGNKKNENKTENMYWRTKESHKKRLDLFAKLPVTKLKKGTKETEMAKREIAKAKAEALGQESALNQVQGRSPATADRQESAKVPSPPAKAMPVPPASVKSETPVEQPKAPKKLEGQIAEGMPKKKRPRKRKRNIPQPIRKNNNVDTTLKNKPAKYIPKTGAPPKPASQKPGQPKAGPPRAEKPEKDKGGEFKFEELKKGEIEINLD